MSILYIDRFKSHSFPDIQMPHLWKIYLGCKVCTKNYAIQTTKQFYKIEIYDTQKRWINRRQNTQQISNSTPKTPSNRIYEFRNLEEHEQTPMVVPHRHPQLLKNSFTIIIIFFLKSEWLSQAVYSTSKWHEFSPLHKFSMKFNRQWYTKIHNNPIHTSICKNLEP